MTGQRETKKPPLGVKPDRIWKEQRLKELVKAMGRHEATVMDPDIHKAQDAIDLIAQWAKEIVDLGLAPAVRWS